MDLHKNMFYVKGTSVHACEKSADLPTEPLKRNLSHFVQIAIVKIENFVWTAAHLG